MKKSKTVRTLVAAGCIASAGCVSAPKPRPPPPAEECPPGAEAAHKRLGIHPGNVLGVCLNSVSDCLRLLPVRDGQRFRAEMLPQVGSRVPASTMFDGRLYPGTERIYGRFTQATLPTGEILPVCLEVMVLGEHERGTWAEAGSTASEGRAYGSISLQVVERFK